MHSDVDINLGKENKNMRIWKFELMISMTNIIQAPSHIVPLSVGLQGDKLCLWGIVDVKGEGHQNCFYVLATGEEMPLETKMHFVGTVQQQPFVWHIFQKIN